MTTRLARVRALMLAGLSLGWAAACGSADSASTTKSVCLIYVGGRQIPEPTDGSKNCPPGMCNYQSQEGCAATQNCAPHYDTTSGTISAACVLAGTQQVGDVCNDTDQHVCAKGLVCVDDVCAKMCCDGDYTACGAGQSCFRVGSKFKVPPPPGSPASTPDKIVAYDARLGTCAPVGTCDVLDPNACSDDTKHPICRIVDHTGAVACEGASEAGDANLGETCSEDHQCGKGQHCAGNAAFDGGASVPTFCVRFCRWGACHGEPSCPPAEGVCVHFDTDPDGVGECTPNWKGPGKEIPSEAIPSGDAGVKPPDAAR